MATCRVGQGGVSAREGSPRRLTAFVFLPGSVYMLLASNFGALKGYLIAATAFFGFLVMLSAVWLFGIPGTTPLTGPKGTQPTFKFFTVNDPQAAPTTACGTSRAGPAPAGRRRPRASSRRAARGHPQGRPGRGPADGRPGPDRRDQRRHRGLQRGAGRHQPRAKVFYTIQDGTEVAAMVISPATPPEGSGLQRPDFAPKTFRLPRPGQPVPAEHPVPDRLHRAVRGPPVPARHGRTPPAPGPGPHPDPRGAAPAGRGGGGPPLT